MILFHNPWHIPYGAQSLASNAGHIHAPGSANLIHRLLTLFTLNVRFHDAIEIRFVDYSTSFRTFCFLLQVLAKEIQVKFAVLDLGASL